MLTVALLFKHFICDFPLQAFPWMYRNKGIYGHAGGLAHAGIHAAGMWIVLAFFFPWWLAAVGGCIDAVAHYHIDWVKVNLTAVMGWRPDNSDWFWVLLGADQLLHYLTYLAIIAIL